MNADGIIGTSESHLGYNLYTYCENNPIIYKDIEGNFLGAIGAAIANVGKKIIQAVTTVVSSTIGAVFNMPVSASMLNKSMNNSNNKINSITEKKLITKVKKSSEMKKEINSCVSKNKNNKTFTCMGNIEFNNDLDLKYSVHGANYIIQGATNENTNTIDMQIKVYDIYDFGEGEYPPHSLTEAANFFGTTYENNKLLTPYYWDINYEVTIFKP